MAISALIASVGVILPGYSYFTTYTPPLWEGASIVTGAIAGFVIVLIFFYSPKRSVRTRQKLPPLVKKAATAIIASVSVLILYVVLLAYCTVVEPGTNSRYQIGFGKAEWSLTDEGKKVKLSHPNESVEDWMLDDALFKKDGPSVLWHKETIILSGVLMIIIFLSTFVMWALGWALLAKQIMISERKPAA